MWLCHDERNFECLILNFELCERYSSFVTFYFL